VKSPASIIARVVAVSPGAAAVYRRWTVESPAWVRFAKQIQAQALFAASKRVLRDPDTGSIRRLDFSLGPRNDQIEPKNLIEDQNEELARNEKIADEVANLVLEIAKSYDGRIAEPVFQTSLSIKLEQSWCDDQRDRCDPAARRLVNVSAIARLVFGP
jgi:hypothetical protein